MNLIKYNIENRTAYITLNRPEKRNALNDVMVSELKSAVKKAEEDKNAKLVILKAEGEAFCAGADLAYLQKLQSNSYEENLNDSKELAELFEMIYSSKKIFIAQVQGHAIAGGAGLATVCDFIFSVPDAKYGYTEVSIGFVPAIVSIFLLRKIGEAKAKELLLTGRIISAEKAMLMNIINKVVVKERLEEEVHSFANALLINASEESLKLTKQLINEVQQLELKHALDFASEMNAKARETSDCKKGIQTFLNKEKITW